MNDDNIAPETSAEDDFESQRRKPIREEPLLGRLYIRTLSRPLTPLFLRIGWTPNQITIFFLGLMVLGAAMQVEQELRVVSIAGAILLQIGIIVDAVDGEVARIRRIFSIKGPYLDMVGHRIVHALLFCAIAIGLYRRDGAVTPMFVAMVASCSELALTLVLYAKWRALLDKPALMRAELDKIDGTPSHDRKRLKAGFANADAPPNLLIRAWRTWFGTDYVPALLLTALVLAIADRLVWMLWLYAAVQGARFVYHLGKRVILPFEPDIPPTQPAPSPKSE